MDLRSTGFDETKDPDGTAVVEVGTYRISQPPAEQQRKEATNFVANKRYHGTRTPPQWYPPMLIQDCKDRFGYMFPTLVRGGLEYTPENRALLEELGDIMGDKDGGPGQNNSSLPAGYTYLGQFIDHDITLDVFSNINEAQSANSIPNMRTPILDLDAVYGRGPALDTFLYDHSFPAGDPRRGVKMLLGTNRNTGNGGPLKADDSESLTTNFDVPRTADQTAIIGDPRNDENLLVVQLHHAFLRFHNAVVEKLITDKGGNLTSTEQVNLFSEAKRIVLHHYQWVVFNDFVRRIARADVVDDVVKKGVKVFVNPQFIMPVEFSVAAYRFGHSLIRDQYFVNFSLHGNGPTPPFLNGKAATLGQIFEFNRPPRLPVFTNWVVDFNLFFEARPLPNRNGVRFNNARKFDSKIAKGLEELPGEPDNFMKMLAQRNLVRSLALGVPMGQAIARYLGVPVLTEAELLAGAGLAETALFKKFDGLLLRKTPLWFYILKEAEVRENGERLGEVGSRIVAETFWRILKEDKQSFLYVRNFKPSLPRFGGKPAGDFDMADLLNFAGVLQQ
ncbi:MAG: hypothetical protein H7Z72_12680 [Bacteroidetes bacterium]|nr:hypothetical protein [Fibrella sp.]